MPFSSSHSAAAAAAIAPKPTSRRPDVQTSRRPGLQTSRHLTSGYRPDIQITSRHRRQFLRKKISPVPCILHTHIIVLPCSPLSTSSHLSPSSCTHSSRMYTQPVMNHITPQLPPTQSNADQLDQPMALQPAGESSPNDLMTAHIIPGSAYTAAHDHHDSMMLEAPGTQS